MKVQKINNKGRKMSQQEEMKNLTLLGNKETPYILNTLHKSWSLFDNRPHW